MDHHETLRLPTILPIRACGAGLCIAREPWTHPERVIDCHELLFVRQGSLEVREEEQTFSLEAGQTLILWPGRRHGGAAASPADLRVYWVDFTIDQAAGKPREWEDLIPQHTTVGRPDLLTELCHRFLDDQTGNCLNPVSANLLVMLMLSEVAHSRPVNEVQLGPLAVLAQRAEAYIQGHFDRPISASAVAHALDCNPDYLGRAVRAIYGTTLTSMIHQRRLRQARAMLMDGGMTVAQIARACGFDDPGYFRRIFTRYEGMRPLAYRRLYARMHIIGQ